MHGAADGTPLWLVTPFLLLLAAMAAMPFVNGPWWGKWYRHVAAGLGLGQSVGKYLHELRPAFAQISVAANGWRL